jgi:hypothetical protein
MPDQESIDQDVLSEVSTFSDRLVVILGEAVMEEIEKAESEAARWLPSSLGRSTR